MYLRVDSTSIELCNSFLSIHVIFNKNSHVLHYIGVTLHGHLSRPSVRLMPFAN